MLHRLIRELSIESYWLRKEIVRRWRLDTPVGVVGIIALVSGIALFMVTVQGIAKIIRGAIPWVAGHTVGTLYWSSLGFALKASFVFILFCSSLIFYFLLKMNYRK
jgi:hypothetical protein